MIVNPEKSHFMSVSNDTHDKDGFHYDNLPFKNTNKRQKADFSLKKICPKAGQILSALPRLPVP